jgi:predicted PurR-regulated permease PerM
VALLLVGFLTLIGALFVVFVPLIAHDLRVFIGDLPAMVDRTVIWIEDVSGYDVPDDWAAYLQGPEVRGMLEGAAGPLAGFAAAIVGGFFAMLGFLAELLLIPVFAFYFLLDWHGILGHFRRIIPPRHRAQVVEVVTEIDGVVSSWIRGQFTVVAILAVLYAISFKIIGIHLAITIGLVVGLLTIIPFLGTFAGAGITAAVILLDWNGPRELLAVGGVFVVLHVLESMILTPKIVGKKVGLGEASAMFAVIAGGNLLGFTGVLLAVPIAASIAVLVRRAFARYEKSDFFGTEDDDLTNRPVDPIVGPAAHVALDPSPSDPPVIGPPGPASPDDDSER